LMAGHAYRTTRVELNWISAPQGWTPLFPVPDPATSLSFTATGGFEAVSFQNIATPTNIVISFAGTNPADISGDVAADLALALGNGSSQLLQAADYYLQVKASAPAGATISFTGHSLGGGLASLVAVMFGESAQTFDQAPFLNSATNILVAQNLRTYLTQKESGNITNLDQLLAPLDAYITALDPTNTNKIAADTLAGRQGLVSNINVQGEFLSSWYGVPSSNRIGTQADIANSNNISGLDLHSQALLSAMLQSGDTQYSSATDPTLGQVTFKLPDLLKMIFDSKLYYNDPNNTDASAKENFLEHIVNHQATVIDPATYKLASDSNGTDLSCNCMN